MYTTKTINPERKRYEMPSCISVDLVPGSVLCVSEAAANQAFESGEVDFVW